jgi:histidine triad (HIT) family protein
MGLEVQESDRGNCLFCGIIERDPADQIFFANDDVVAFLDIAPATRGHTLVVPRIHASNAFDVGGDDFSATMRGAWSVANILKRELNPLGLTLIQSSGEAAWQDVFHLHVHLVPRYQGDSLVRPWGQVPSKPEAVGQLNDSRALTVDLRGASGYEQ